jgi:hypothetical protein
MEYRFYCDRFLVMRVFLGMKGLIGQLVEQQIHRMVSYFWINRLPSLILAFEQVKSVVQKYMEMEHSMLLFFFAALQVH